MNYTIKKNSVTTNTPSLAEVSREFLIFEGDFGVVRLDASNGRVIDGKSV